MPLDVALVAGNVCTNDTTAPWRTSTTFTLPLLDPHGPGLAALPSPRLQLCLRVPTTCSILCLSHQLLLSRFLFTKHDTMTISSRTKAATVNNTDILKVGTCCHKLSPWSPSTCSSKYLNHDNESPACVLV